MAKVRNLCKRVVLALITIYQYLLSPFIGNCCRFYPSCSNYMILAIQRYGIIKGCYLGFKRLLRCHPWSVGGVDDVP